MPARETAAKIRAAMPDLPFMPLPETLIIAVFLRHEMPRIGPLDLKLPLVMRVPRLEGFMLFKLHASMPFAASGASVLGCRTFEPKNESSIASS